MAFADKFGGFWLWTNQSTRMSADPQYRIDADDFIVTLTVRGSNTSQLMLKVRVGKGSDGVQVATVP